MKLLLVIVIVTVDYYARKSQRKYILYKFDSQNTATGRTKFDLKHLYSVAYSFVLVFVYIF